MFHLRGKEDNAVVFHCNNNRLYSYSESKTFRQNLETPRSSELDYPCEIIQSHIEDPFFHFQGNLYCLATGEDDFFYEINVDDERLFRFETQSVLAFEPLRSDDKIEKEVFFHNDFLLFIEGDKEAETC